MSGNSSYRCTWRYITEGGTPVEAAGQVVQLQQSEHQDVLAHFTEQYEGVRRIYSYPGFRDYVKTLTR